MKSLQHNACGNESKLRSYLSKAYRKAGLIVRFLHGHNFCKCMQARVLANFWAIVAANTNKSGKEKSVLNHVRQAAGLS